MIVHDARTAAEHLRSWEPHPVRRIWQARDGVRSQNLILGVMRGCNRYTAEQIAGAEAALAVYQEALSGGEPAEADATFNARKGAAQ